MTSSFPLNSAVGTTKKCCVKDTQQHLSAQDKFVDQLLLHTVYNVDAVVDCSPTRRFSSALMQPNQPGQSQLAAEADRSDFGGILYL